MIFKDKKAFKKTFRELFKKYHPDNKETGDAEQFMKYKKLYDKALKKVEKNAFKSCIKIVVNMFDVVLGCEKSIQIADTTKILKIKPLEPLKHPTKKIKIGNSDLTIKFVYDNLKLTDIDIQILREMRKRYE